MDATPPPRREPLDLNSAVRNAVSTSFGDVVVGLSLVLLFSFSFVGAWFQTELFCPEPVYGPGTIFGGGVGTCADWIAGGTLWSGFGLLPALLLVAALLFFVIRRLPQVRLRLPVPEALIWVVFAVVEIGLFILNWVTSNGGVLSTGPGWALWVGVGLAGLLGVGGCTMFFQSEGSGLPGPAPGLPASNLPIGTLSPHGTRWFDGAGWRDVVEAVPPGAPRSEDGGHWWDGQGWRPVPASPVPGPARATGRRAGPGPGFPAA